jgi:multifunctional methyltransferase subunit TRM112
MLLTPSFLVSRTVVTLQVTEQAEEEIEFNPEFLVRMLPRIEYQVLRGALVQIGMADTVPAAMPENPAEDEEFLKALHHVLLEVQIVEGELECPGSGVKFPIANGIPNMLLPEA